MRVINPILESVRFWLPAGAQPVWYFSVSLGFLTLFLAPTILDSISYQMDSHYSLALTQALAWIKTIVEPTGILVSGSIIRGNPNATSDFDIFVIHEQDFRQRIQRRFSGVACEVFINTVEHVRAYFESELQANRPVTAHMLATGQFFLGESNAQLLALVEEAKHYVSLAKPLTAEQLTMRRYGIATLFEDATDVLESDLPTAMYAVEMAVTQAVELVFAMNQQPLPRLKERLQSLILIEPEAGALVTHFYQAANPTQKYELAKAILLAVTGKLGFFVWSTTPE